MATISSQSISRQDSTLIERWNSQRPLGERCLLRVVNSVASRVFAAALGLLCVAHLAVGGNRNVLTGSNLLAIVTISMIGVGILIGHIVKLDFRSSNLMRLSRVRAALAEITENKLSLKQIMQRYGHLVKDGSISKAELNRYLEDEVWEVRRGGSSRPGRID